jgi:hypothetical protein
LFPRYADPEDPVRRDDVFDTVFDAKAAAEAAFGRLVQTKFWDNIVADECYIPYKLERDHRPGCEHAARAAALLGCPEREPPTRWLIERGLLIKSDHGYALTTKARAILNSDDSDGVERRCGAAPSRERAVPEERWDASVKQNSSG